MFSPSMQSIGHLSRQPLTLRPAPISEEGICTTGGAGCCDLEEKIASLGQGTVDRSLAPGAHNRRALQIRVDRISRARLVLSFAVGRWLSRSIYWYDLKEF